MARPIALDLQAGRPIALDLCCGLGGWSEGLIAAGWHVIGIDIEDMFAALGETRPEHFELVLGDICKLNGADYAHVSLIVGSSPCQDFSYRAMPWKRAKAMHAPFLGIWLFWQQFRIQREASEAKGEYVPMVVENVRGAIPWVGRSRANFGSYHLWGDVPALIPQTAGRRMKFPAPCGPRLWSEREAPEDGSSAFHGEGRKVPGFRFDGAGGSFQTASVNEHQKAPAKGWFNDSDDPNRMAMMPSKSPARKAASARIAKIPLVLSTWVGMVYMPKGSELG